MMDNTEKLRLASRALQIIHRISVHADAETGEKVAKLINSFAANCMATIGISSTEQPKN